LGHLWETFKKRIAEGENGKAVLDSLGVKSYCCRSLLLTNVDTLPQIAKFKR
jgi:DNA-directed RNA polymerase subunit N